VSSSSISGNRHDTPTALYGFAGMNRQAIDFYAGDDHTVNLSVLIPGTTTPQDLTGWSGFTLLIKVNAADPDVNAAATVPGTILSPATNGQVQFLLPAAVTGTLKGNYSYTVRALDNAGNHQTVSVGPVVGRVS
jgi:hypothetical protein